MGWASGRKWGGVSARAAILAIANYANDMYFCWALQQSLAAESEQSPDSIGRRIGEFVASGEIRRVKLKRFGRRTHDFLILRPSPYFEAAIEEIEPFIPRGCEIMLDNAAADCGSVEDEETAAAPPEPPPDAAADCGSVQGTENDTTLPQPAAHATALVRVHEPILEPLENPLKSPLPHEGQPSEKESGSAKEEKPNDPDFDKRLASLQSTYPEPSNYAGAVRVTCGSFNAAQWALALRGAQGARAVRAKNPRKQLLDLSKFVRDPAQWAEYARFAPPPPPEFEVLEPGSLAWRVCALMREIVGVRTEANAVLRVLIPMPDPAQMAQALDLDRSLWRIVDDGSKSFMAWGALIKRWSGRWPEAQRVYVDNDGNPVPRELAATVPMNIPGRPPEFVPKWKRGLAVPWPWPPRKDGTLAREGPPGPGGSGSSLMTEADYAEL